MSKTNSKKYIRFCALHKNGEWRTTSKFESYDYAINDKNRGVTALFNDSNSYLKNKGYSAPIFALVWDERNSEDAYVYSKNHLINKIESRRISTELAESYRVNSPDEQFLHELFVSEDTPSDVAIAKDLYSIMSLEESERDTLIKARIGQGKFRRNVINIWGGEICALTLTPLKEILIASHIKAWRNCENTDERLDGANGILLCAHIDKLFDQHLITFKKVGNEYRLRFNEKLDKVLMKQLGIVEGDQLAISKLKADDLSRFEGYLVHHQSLFNELDV
jgi:putative restriction endonuclease